MGRGICSAGLRAKAVVALGNPDRADDGVAHHVLSVLPPQEGVEYLTSLKTGLDLALSLLEYEKVLVVDADPSLPPGKIALCPLLDGKLRGFRHGLGLAEAFGFLRRMRTRVPEVWVLAIGVRPEQPFRRELSPEIKEVLPKAKEAVEGWLRS